MTRVDLLYKLIILTKQFDDTTPHVLITNGRVTIGSRIWEGDGSHLCACSYIIGLLEGYTTGDLPAWVSEAVSQLRWHPLYEYWWQQGYEIANAKARNENADSA